MSRFVVGRNHHLLPMEPQLVVEADLEPCVCCLPGLWYACPCWSLMECSRSFTNEEVLGRAYLRAYENRLEMNFPYGACCCLTTNLCVEDDVQTYYFDQPPVRTPYCYPLCCIPCSRLCGPPVIHVTTCSFDIACFNFGCKPLCGECVMYSPCDCFGCRAFLCCGPLCYESCAAPLIPAQIKNAHAFLGQARGAVDAYYPDKRGLDNNQMARFEYVNKDGIHVCGHFGREIIQGTPWVRRGPNQAPPTDPNNIGDVYVVSGTTDVGLEDRLMDRGDDHDEPGHTTTYNSGSGYSRPEPESPWVQPEPIPPPEPARAVPESIPLPIPVKPETASFASARPGTDEGLQKPMMGTGSSSDVGGFEMKEQPEEKKKKKKKKKKVVEEEEERYDDEDDLDSYLNAKTY